MTNSLTKIDDIILQSPSHDKPMLVDARFISSTKSQPTVIFIHGFKGFKDWGHWNLIADQIAKQGFIFIKINLSHNGTTPEKPVDFDDLEAFSNNTYSIELDDVDVVIDYLHATTCRIPHIDLENIFLIGHSRGGGIALLKAAQDKRIKGVITWASVSDFERRWPKDVILKWKAEGIHYIYNERTKQHMPMKYAIVEDLFKNKARLDIKTMAVKLDKPVLFIHGTDDPTVDVAEARELHALCNKGKLVIIKGADHVFNGKHPFEAKELPPQSQELVDNTLTFLHKISSDQ